MATGNLVPWSKVTEARIVKLWTSSCSRCPAAISKLGPGNAIVNLDGNLEASDAMADENPHLFHFLVTRAETKELLRDLYHFHSVPFEIRTRE